MDPHTVTFPLMGMENSFLYCNCSFSTIATLEDTHHVAIHYNCLSLTSVCSKVMEHIVFHLIMQHVQHYGILSEFQHGFRPGYSCQTQLIKIQHAMD